MISRTWPPRPTPPAGGVVAAVLDGAYRAVGQDVAGVLDVDVDAISGVPVIQGSLPSWDLVVVAGHAAASRWRELRGSNPGDVVVEATTGGGEAPPRSRDGLATAALPDSADVVVVGAGICGLMVAYALAQAGSTVAVVDGSYRIAEQTTSWNNGMVHPGHDPQPDTVKARLTVQGNAQWAAVAAAVGLPFQRRASLVVGFGTDDQPRLDAFLARARANAVPGAKLISGDEARSIEPRLSSAVSGALYFPTTSSIDAAAASEALAVAVRRLGSTVTLAAPVGSITTGDGGVTGVVVGDRHIAARVVVNAAGVFADLLARTAGSRRYSIHPRRGSLVLFDPGESDRYHTSVGPIPGEFSKGGGMTARPDGLTTGGPTAVEQQGRVAEPPSQDEVDHILGLGQRIYPAFPTASIVNIGSAVRAATYCEDFVVGPAPGIRGLIDVAGTQSPAIASAPAIARSVVGALRAHGYLPAP